MNQIFVINSILMESTKLHSSVRIPEAKPLCMELVVPNLYGIVGLLEDFLIHVTEW